MERNISFEEMTVMVEENNRMWMWRCLRRKREYKWIVEKEEETSKLLKREMGKKRTGNEVTDETKI